MTDIDRDEHYADLMSYGVAAHNNGDLHDALGYARQAYEISDEGSWDAGHAARDIAMRLHRLGLDTEDIDQDWRQTALDAHSLEGIERPTTRQLREAGMTQICIGAIGVGRAVDRELTRWGQVEKPETWIDTMRTGWERLKTARNRRLGPDSWLDAYEVQASRRVSIAESLYGNRREGRKIAAYAILIAGAAESPVLETSNPNMTKQERRKVKARAAAGAVATMGVNVLASIPTQKTRSVALQLADRIL